VAIRPGTGRAAGGALAALLIVLACLAGAPVQADAPRAAPATGTPPVGAPPAGAGFMPLREPLERFPQADVRVVSGAKTHAFRVWVADTPARREQGLMWVRSLPADRGMLFVFDAPQPASFWMKNTYVALDLLFVAPDGRIVRVAENAQPESTALIDSMGIVLGVLELRGGTARRLGIAAGDRLLHPAFAAR
jgi:uncharacterized membrane protein (UPF0127 family)